MRILSTPSLETPAPRAQAPEPVSVPSPADPSRATIEEQFRINGQMITRLTEEVSKLKKAIAELLVRKDRETQAPPKAVTPQPEPAFKWKDQETQAPPKAVATEPEPASKPAPTTAADPLTIVPIVPIVSTTPAVQDVKPPSPPSEKSSPLSNAPAGKVPAPVDPERKVAFLTKLWDYLNDPAFDAPTQKTDKTR